MDTNQPTSSTPPPYSPPPASPVYAAAPAPPGLFGTKTPSAVAFVIGILLFLLPFTEIKCGGTTLTNKSGLNYSLGKEWKAAGGYGKETLGDVTSKTTGEKEGNAQLFAIAALALGVLGLALAFTGPKTAGGGGMIVGVLAAGALIALMFEVKKWFNGLLAKEAADKAKQGTDSLGLDKLGDIKPALAFTPWFYIAIIVFLAAAFFCYKRMSINRT